MSEEQKRRKAQRKPRQEWQPHWILRLLRNLWMILFSAAKIALGAAATVLIICVVCLLVFAGTLGDYLQEDILPNSDYVLDNIGLDLNSTIYYVDENDDIQVLQEVYAASSRKWAEFEEFPQDLIHATIAIEDKRFYEHQGVDWITTVKACARIFFGDASMGGSTITQQLIKNRTGEDSITVQRKVLEIFRATQLEKRYDKPEILEWYLNTIYLGQGCNGVKTAAATYFGKELEFLTTAECAALISITNNPSIFDPYDDEVFEFEGQMLNGYERNKLRKEDTLWSMWQEGYLTEKEYRDALAEEIVLKNGIDFEDQMAYCENEDCGYHGIVSTLSVDEYANYYCPDCGTLVSVTKSSSQEIYSWYVDTVLEDVARDLAKKNGETEWNDDIRDIYMLMIQRGGYHIYSCIDMDVQEALDTIYTDLDAIPDARSGQQLQSAMVIVDIRTGDVAGIVGGVGAKEYFDQFNRATDNPLQTGSSIKPLTVYAPAFEIGAITPATVIKDLPYSYDNGCFPNNDSYTYSYSRTVYSAVVASVNAVAVNVLDRIGLDYSFDFGKNLFGLTDLVEEYVTEDGYPFSDVGLAPLALGAQTWGVTVRDMATAFATFANHGEYRRARTYTKVYDSEGNLVLDNTQESRQILSDKTINYMNYCLEAAVWGGTGGEAYLGNVTIAGKTGSTNDWKDRWFCGFSGYYAAATWCGYDAPEPISTYDGGNPAAQLWRKVMRPLHEGLDDIPLYDLSGMGYISMCLDSGGIATEACTMDIRNTDGFSRTASSVTYSEDITESYCTKHILVDYCVEGKAGASEWCAKFAELEDSTTTIEKRGLVKMTETEISRIRTAGYYGLKPVFLQDNYVYFVDNNGNPQKWTGFNGNVNQDVDSPYLMCTVHTKEAWEKYEADKKAEEEASKPSAPGIFNPVDPDATVPPETTEPTQPAESKPTT